MTKLHLIHGTGAPDTLKERVRKRVKALPKPPAMLQCQRCGGRELTITVIGAQIQGGKVKGGTKQYLCTCCLLQGERIVVA